MTLQFLHPTRFVPQTQDSLPIASWLLPVSVRPKVHALLRFARAAADITNDREMSLEQKLRGLYGLDAGPLGRAAPHARRLLAAFKCDAVRNRVADWNDLLDYCRLSAVPVGTMLLDLHDEPEETRPALESLCIALRLLSLTRRIAADRQRHNRIYLPMQWLQEAGLGPEALDASCSGPELHRVLQRLYAEIDLLLEQAAPLPHLVREWRLRFDAWAVLRLARRQLETLRHSDPLQQQGDAGTPCTVCSVVRQLAGLDH